MGSASQLLLPYNKRKYQKSLSGDQNGPPYRHIPRCSQNLTSSTTQQGKGASIWPCSHLFCGTFVPFEFFPGPVLKVLSVSLTGNLPNRSQDLSVEDENLLPSHELLGEGEKQITTKYPPAPSKQTTRNQKSPFKQNKTKTKAHPGGLLGQCTPIRPPEAARRGGGGCGEPALRDSASKDHRRHRSRRAPGVWGLGEPGLPASASAPREASGRTPWQPPGAQDRKWSLGLTGTRKRK